MKKHDLQTAGFVRMCALLLSAGCMTAAGAMTFDFETGDLQGWQVVDGAFEKLVTDLAKEHNTGKPYTKGGRFFLSTLETKRGTPNDGFTGVVESPTIRLTGPAISFRIGGGKKASFALVDRASGQALRTAHGANGEAMRVDTWNVPEAVGKDVYFRVEDPCGGSWAHLTLDDVSFEGTIGKADFAERRAEAMARLPKDFPAKDPGAPAVLVVMNEAAKSIASELFTALDGRVAVHLATPKTLDRRLAERPWNLVVLHGSADLSWVADRVRGKCLRTKLLYLVTQGAWGLSYTGIEQIWDNYNGSRSSVAATLASSVRCTLRLDPVPDAAYSSAEAAIRELGGKFPVYPTAAHLDQLAKLRAEKAPRPAFDEFLKVALVRNNPLVNGQEIVYTTRDMWAQDHHNTATLFQCGEINQNSYRTQGALKALDVKTGTTREIVPLVEGRTVRDPEVDYDGRRIVFSMRAGKTDDYHVNTVNADGSGLKQLTRAQGVSDIDPVWLPDGDILFGATREPKYCMCNRHIMCNLYRMKADGANIHQIGKSTLFEGHPTVLSDGRILYDRWEYVDRDFGDAQGLWVCNPDGTRHAIYWGNNTTSPGGVINARELPGSGSQVIASLGSCHDKAWGALGIIDRSRGVDGPEPVLRTWPADYRAKIHAGGKEDFDSTRPLPVKYADPYPIDEAHFIATRTNGRAGEMALVYLDLHGNEVVFHEEAPGCHSPVLLRAAKKPVIQSEQRNFDAPDAPGRFYVQNVYIGTHMQGVKPGSVKALRVVESPEKRTWIRGRGWFGHGEEACAMNWHSFENKRILGTVPVEEDGSAYFEVPGNTYVYFQALDAEGKMIQSMRSGAYLQPGELYGCVGCHENRVGDVPKTEKQPLAMRRAPSKLDGAYNLRGLERGTKPHLYSFQKEVQPIFTAKCASCHDYGTKAGAKLNLSGDLGAYFCTSYVDLWSQGFVTCIGGGPAEIQPAYSWGAHASKLTKKLYGHAKVQLTDDERDRLITWMDVNAPYWPCYACAWPESYGGRMPITRAEHDELEKLTGVKIATGFSAKQREQLNFTRPELSRILEGVKGTPAGEAALAILRKGAERLKTNPRADMDGFRPCAQDLERENRYQRRQNEERKVYESIRNGAKRYDGVITVKAVVTGADKKSRREIELPVTREADGALRATFKASDVKDAWLVDFQPSCAVAKKGESGFWLGGRGVLGSFQRGAGGWASARNWNVLPYFAMQTPRGAFIAILEGMRFETEERLSVLDGEYRMYARWRVGETGIGAYEDMHLLIYELPAGSDYNAMAKAYRRYKLARAPEMKTTKEKIKERPHLAKLARSVAVRQQCASKPFKRSEDAIDFTPETEHPVRCNCSFDDTLALLRKMKSMGIDDVAMCLAGWQTGGYDGRAPAVFPVEPVAGGEEGLRRLIKGGQELGYIIDAQDNYSDCYTCSPLWDNGNIACVGPNGKLETNGSWCGGRAYNLCLKNAWEVQGFMQDNLRRTADLGFFGCHYIDVFTAAFPYRCLNPKHAANRNEQMRYQIAAAQYCRKTFGGFASECCFDHLLPYVDYINYATAMMRGHRRTIAEGKTPTPEKFVPFFELAFHDYVLSNPDKITQEVLAQPENLVLVEFGGRPIFYHVGENNIAGIKKAYDQFVGLRHLQLEEMVEHKELAPGFMRVTYGNGERVYVNHTKEAKSQDGVNVPAQDFSLVK